MSCPQKPGTAAGTAVTVELGGEGADRHGEFGSRCRRQFDCAAVPALPAPSARRGRPGPTFAIDAGKLADEARYDGIFVLRTNARVTPLQAVLRYRDLLQVEDLFRRAKAVLRTRPIYHASDAAIRGHLFCSFLALVLQKDLADRCRAAGVAIEWADLLRDLDRLQEATIDKDGKRITTRAPVAGQVGRVFQAAGVALPPNTRDRAT
jgi:hypothetical protein